MSNVIDYIKANAAVSFQELPLNEVDIIAINEIGYLPIGDYGVGQISDLELPFLNSESPKFDFLITKERVELLNVMVTSKRYFGLAISDYVNDISPEFEKQFSAMRFTLPEINHQQVVFRGTDDTIIGWKEDFKLTYMREIPAQRSAITYLTNILNKYSGEFIVSGHSKGGNLAVYASSRQTAEQQKRLKLIFMLDAPGFQEEFLQADGFRRLTNRLIILKPEDSVVGVMLRVEIPALIVVATNFGIAQHSVMTWQLSENGYFILGHQTDTSKSLDKTFDQWMTELSNQELKILFDTIFDSFIDQDLQSIDDLSNPKNVTKILALLNSFNQLTKAKKTILQKSLKQLLNILIANRMSLGK